MSDEEPQLRQTKWPTGGKKFQQKIQHHTMITYLLVFEKSWNGPLFVSPYPKCLYSGTGDDGKHFTADTSDDDSEQKKNYIQWTN